MFINIYLYRLGGPNRDRDGPMPRFSSAEMIELRQRSARGYVELQNDRGDDDDDDYPDWAVNFRKASRER